jgi:hypothetical protein
MSWVIAHATTFARASIMPSIVPFGCAHCRTDSEVEQTWVFVLRSNERYDEARLLRRELPLMRAPDALRWSCHAAQHQAEPARKGSRERKRALPDAPGVFAGIARSEANRFSVKRRAPKPLSAGFTSRRLLPLSGQ